MLNNKIAVITGASRGIGLATVELFAQNNAEIWACARERTDEFENKIKEIAAVNSAVIKPVYFDVADHNGVKEAFHNIGKESKRVDILVNNAGISLETLFNMTSLDTMRRVMEVNFLSQIDIAQIASRYMIKNKCGSIVNVASVAGIEAEEGGIAYGSSKASILFATKIMSLELGKYDIRANCVSPGFINTDMWKKRSLDVMEKVLKETPLNRMGKPEEVAQTILFLASDMSSFITGQNIVVDGGRKG